MWRRFNTEEESEAGKLLDLYEERNLFKITVELTATVSENVKMTSSQWIFFLCLIPCLLYHAAAEDQINLTAEPGDTVTLPCGVHSNISIIVVEWSRTDLETEYVFLQRGSRSESFNQHESFKNRVELKDREKKDGDVSLILRNVTFNDTGTYECRVVQRRTNHRKRSILKTDPINTINLRVEPGTNKDGGDKDVTVGLVAGLSVVVLLLCVFGFIIFKKRQKSIFYQPPSEEADEQQQV
ncbi:sodium channel subunit beta-2-like [Anabas testudineus]|uniref:sodium channel subunit beta-2-like n=1 Tax=Anabas testudineus TaxID=64144 RepID=UPI00143CE71B|nr:sodium channel subunit beta-2-like [Anabas testudineus]